MLVKTLFRWKLSLSAQHPVSQTHIGTQRVRKNMAEAIDSSKGDELVVGHDESGNVVLYTKVCVDFSIIIAHFEKAFVKTISHPTLSPKRIYITCSKEYINEPNKSWWMMLLVDAILSAFHNSIPSRPNGYFDPHLALAKAFIFALSTEIPPNAKRYQLDVLNIPLTWHSLDLIHSTWTTLASIKNYKHNEKRAKLLHILRMSCVGREHLFPSIIEEGLSILLEKMWAEKLAAAAKETSDQKKRFAAAKNNAKVEKPATRKKRKERTDVSDADRNAILPTVTNKSLAKSPTKMLSTFNWPNVEDRLFGLLQTASLLEEAASSMVSEPDKKVGETMINPFKGSMEYPKAHTGRHYYTHPDPHAFSEEEYRHGKVKRTKTENIY